MTASNVWPVPLLPCNDSRCLSNASHAHPYPKNGSPTKLQEVQELFANLDIDVVLKGLPGASNSSATDVYCPEVRRSPSTNHQHVNHLDVVSCWKGLSCRQASEVGQWERLFKSSLENQVRHTVLREVRESLYNLHGEPKFPRQYSLSKTFIKSCVIDFTSIAAPRLIGIDVSKLVYDIIEMYYEDELRGIYNWFESSKNMPAAVYNFLRTRDCFLDTFPYPSLEVSFGYEQFGSCLNIVGDVNWHPPSINFPNLPIQLHSGAEYRISPQYVEPDFGSEYSPGFSRFIIEPEYTVTSRKMPIAWDSNLRCFRSIVPFSKQRQFPVERVNESTKATQITETTFSAKITMVFPENVRFEQTTRFNIKLEIESTMRRSRVMSSLPIPTYNADAEEIKSPREETLDLHLTPRSDRSAGVGPENFIITSQPPLDSWLPSYTNTPLSKRGRKCDHRYMSVDSDHDRRSASSNTSSVGHYFELVRKYSPWSCDGFAEKVASQIDVLNQTRSPGLEVDKNAGVIMKNAEDDVNHDIFRPLLPDQRVSPKNPGEEENDSFTRVIISGGYAKALLGREGRIRLLRRQKIETVLEAIGEKPIERQEKINNQRFVEDLSESTSVMRPFDASIFRDAGRRRVPSDQMIPRKRKANKQVPLRRKSSRIPSSIQFDNFPFDKSEYQHLEIATKRQRLSERIDSGVDMRDTAHNEVDEIRDDENCDHDLHGSAHAATGRLGEDFRAPSSSSESCGGSERLNDDSESTEGSARAPYSMRSRAYEVKLASSKAMADFRTKGFVKKTVFHKRSKTQLKKAIPAPPNSEISLVDSTFSTKPWSKIADVDVDGATPDAQPDGDCFPQRPQGREEKYHVWMEDLMKQTEASSPSGSLDQREIILNYLRLIKEKQNPKELIEEPKSSATIGRLKGTECVDEEERKAFEKIFLNENSETGEDDWSTDNEKDLSADLETMVLTDG